MDIDEKYMRRALELAAKGGSNTLPNPRVGAVIVGPDGNIIGEGYHRACGEAHAEVNAINSVKDKELLKNSVMYVTLEPCAHYGRTGPCAKLIIDSGIPEVVVATRDPFDKVDGRGIEMLRQAGVKVHVGMLGFESKMLNSIFFITHTKHRPLIMLKWAQSADGFLSTQSTPYDPPTQISNPLTYMLMHHARSFCDGILVGSGTILADNPRLSTRLWPGRSPRPIILDHRRRVPADALVMQQNPLIISDDKPLADILNDLYKQGFTCIMVEGGSEVLNSFISENLWDMARVEVAPVRFGEYGTVKAPDIPGFAPIKVVNVEGNLINYFNNCDLFDVKNI